VNAVDMRGSPPAERGRSISARSFASLDDIGRRRRLHREVVQASSSAMVCRKYVDQFIGRISHTVLIVARGI
jgi:hypothetical protein